MKADEIEKIVERIIELKKTKTAKQINEMTEFNEFKTQNRYFFETLLEGPLDTVIFKQMMSYKRRLEAGEDQYSVDVKFGQFMAEKYIDPVIKQDPVVKK